MSQNTAPNLACYNFEIYTLTGLINYWHKMNTSSRGCKIEPFSVTLEWPSNAVFRTTVEPAVDIISTDGASCGPSVTVYLLVCMKHCQKITPNRSHQTLLIIWDVSKFRSKWRYDVRTQHTETTKHAVVSTCRPTPSLPQITSTDLGVASSSRFLFRAYAQTDRQTDATECPTDAAATVGVSTTTNDLV